MNNKFLFQLFQYFKLDHKFVKTIKNRKIYLSSLSSTIISTSISLHYSIDNVQKKIKSKSSSRE